MRLIIIFLLTTPHLINAQNVATIKVRGEVRNVDTNEPVPHAHVRLLKHALGVSANSEGLFSLILSKSLENESLVCSSIGYKNKTVKIQDVLKNGIILLQDTTIVLENVTVSDLQPEAIILSAIKKSGTSYDVNPYHLEAFYRTSFKENDGYVRLFEAAVTVADKGFNQPKGYQVKVEQYRKSNDYREIRWRQGSNFLFNYLKKDNIRNKRFFLDKKSTKNYHYELGGITEFDGDEIYHIIVKLKDSLEVGYKANVYLRSKDYAVIAVNDVTVIKKPKPYPLSDSLRIAFTGGETQVKYVDIDGRLYLSYSSALSKHEAFNDKGDFKGILDMDEEMVVFDVKQDKSKPTKKVDKKGDIYLADYPYNEDFWQNFNTPVDTQLSHMIKRDLNKREDLAEQFKKNGGPKKR